MVREVDAGKGYILANVAIKGYLLWGMAFAIEILSQ